MEHAKSYRSEHVKEDIRHALVKILSEMENPNIKNAFLSITKVDISCDFSCCKVFVSSLYGLEKCNIAVTSLNSSIGFVRCEIARILKPLRLRIIPEVCFIADDSIEYGINMSNKITHIVDFDEKSSNVSFENKHIHNDDNDFDNDEVPNEKTF